MKTRSKTISLKPLKEIRLKNMLMIVLSGILSAAGVKFFLEPAGLYDSGISGTSMLLDQLTPAFLTLSIFLLVLDIPLFLYGLKRQGILFTFYSIFAVAVYSFTAFMLKQFVMPLIPEGVSPLAGKDVFLCAVFGGLICGTGSGLSVRYGGAIDGIEVLAVIFAKKIGISVGSFMMIYNVILYIICGILMKNWMLPLYSIVTYMIALRAIDFIVDGLDRAKAAMIVTTKPDEVCSALTQSFETGATRISAKGGYSNTDKTIVYFVVNRFQVARMKDIVHGIDASAYITINEIADVFPANTNKE